MGDPEAFKGIGATGTSKDYQCGWNTISDMSQGRLKVRPLSLKSRSSGLWRRVMFRRTLLPIARSSETQIECSLLWKPQMSYTILV